MPKETLRICIINDHFSIGPGGHHRIQNLGMALEKLNQDVIYICPYGISSNVIKLAYVYDKYLKHSSRKFYLSFYNDFFGIFKNLARLKERLDLVVIELPWTSIKAWNALRAKLRSEYVIFDYADLWTSFWNTTYREPNLFYRYIYRIGSLFEDFNIAITNPLANILTVISSPLGHLLSKLTGRQPHIIMQPIDTKTLFNPNIIDNSRIMEVLIKRCNAERFIMLGAKPDGEWIISEIHKLLKILENEKIKFLMLGSYPRAKKLCKIEGLDKYICILGSIHHNFVPYILKLVDFSIVLVPPWLKSIKYATHNITKISEFLAMGKPVITNSVSVTDYVINNYNGFIVKNYEQLIEKTLLLLNDEKVLRYLSENARKFAVNELDYIKVASEFLSLSKNMLNNSSNNI